MYEYAHGGNAVYETGGAHIIDLSANINPLGVPENVNKAVINGLSACNRYPDSFSVSLRKAIAAYENVEQERIFCGNGASDIIFRLPGALKAKKVLTAAPSFSDYERAAKAYGAEIVRHFLNEENSFKLDDSFCEAVKNERPGLVFLCNPNNPTGSVTERSIIEKLLQTCKETGAVLAVDECFLDFNLQAEKYTSKVFLEKFQNVVIIKAFTKAFALPGIRLGYALCGDEALVSSLCFSGPDWPVSNLAQEAGEAALIGAAAYLKASAQYVLRERTAMEAALSAIGYNVFPSESCYVFIKSVFRFNLCHKLNEKGIRIRGCGNYPGLNDSYYRIAVSTEENNKKFIASVEEVTNKWKQEQKI